MIVKSDAKSDVKKVTSKSYFTKVTSKSVQESVLISEHIERISVSHMRNLFLNLLKFSFQTQFSPAYLDFSITAFVHSALYIY